MLRKYALSLIAPHWRAIVGVVALALVAALLGAADPLVMKFLFDSLEGHERAAVPMALGLLLGVEVGRAALAGWLSVRTWDVRLAVDLSLRERLVSKLTAVSPDYHHGEGVGGTIS